MSSVIAVTADDLALPLEQHVMRTAAALEAHGHLVVLVPPEPTDPLRRRVHTVRAALEADRVAIVPVDLPPLAALLLAEQLRQLAATDLGPGVLAGAARLLSHYLHSGALLGSVSRLDRVDVPVGAHLKSLVPGRHFAVLAHPEPHLSEARHDAVPAGPAFLTQLAVAQGHGVDAGWVTGPLARAWRSLHVREVPLPADSARWWGTGRLVEFTAYIADVGVLYQLVTSVRRDTCGWCGLAVIGDRCLFCSATVDGQQRVRPPERPRQVVHPGPHAPSLAPRASPAPQVSPHQHSALER
ncbi:hypothetical protein [Actinacidiphila glaucinigra]|uniref:Uncharacterized protein n=1 Tax=Actinacidiphila glaucinigra TaxID=235986 RepID=A0A239F4G6_9ACTN|nr:hypothetical protein [Actinacidiphila glaucinigra]SNS51737.1 hypothetical protein SAMN05216252_106310 [Actinacidiphila glaucinigra]